MTSNENVIDRSLPRLRPRRSARSPVAASSRGSSRTSATTSPIQSCRSTVIRSRARTRGTSTRRAKARAARLAPPAAVAAATSGDREAQPHHSRCCRWLRVRVGHAGVLPEDRADVLLHSYDGGGVTIQGPSLLVRKQFAQKFSVSANHYVDKVSSASIDVVTTASPYKEERTQHSVGLDYLHDRWMMNIGFTNSEENDYIGRDVQLRHEPGHLRRPDDGLARLLARQRHGRPARRRDVQRGDRAPALPARPVADPDEEPAARLVVRDDHGRRLPQQSVSAGALRRSDDAARLQLRARDVSAHAHERRRLAFGCATTCRGARQSTPSIASTATRGTSAPTRSRSATRTRSSWAGPSRASCASYSQNEGRFLQRSVPALAIPELHGARQRAQHVREPNDSARRELRHRARRLEVRRARHA